MSNLSSKNSYELAKSISQACSEILLVSSAVSVTPDEIENIFSALCDATECGPCLELFLDTSMIQGDQYEQNLGIINKLRYGICSPLCDCVAEDITQNINVFLEKVETTVTEEQKENIVTRSQEIYGDEIDHDVCLKIINASIQEITDEISTLYDAASEIQLTNGTARKINTTIYINTVINILMTNPDLTQLNSAYSQGLYEIIMLEGDVENAFSANKNIFITLGSVLFIVVMIYIVMVLRRFLN
jgi:hypothetical protein